MIEVRAITVRSCSRDNFEISSSVMPSEKYSFSASRAHVDERQHRDPVLVQSRLLSSLANRGRGVAWAQPMPCRARAQQQ